MFAYIPMLRRPSGLERQRQFSLYKIRQKTAFLGCATSIYFPDEYEPKTIYPCLVFPLADTSLRSTAQVGDVGKDL